MSCVYGGNQDSRVRQKLLQSDLCPTSVLCNTSIKYRHFTLPPGGKVSHKRTVSVDSRLICLKIWEDCLLIEKVFPPGYLFAFHAYQVFCFINLNLFLYRHLETSSFRWFFIFSYETFFVQTQVASSFFSARWTFFKNFKFNFSTSIRLLKSQILVR